MASKLKTGVTLRKSRNGKLSSENDAAWGTVWPMGYGPVGSIASPGRLAGPLTQLQLRKVGTAGKAKEALLDWEYWVKQGYQFRAAIPAEVTEVGYLPRPG